MTRRSGAPAFAEAVAIMVVLETNERLKEQQQKMLLTTFFAKVGLTLFCASTIIVKQHNSEACDVHLFLCAGLGGFSQRILSLALTASAWGCEPFLACVNPRRTVRVVCFLWAVIGASSTRGGTPPYFYYRPSSGTRRRSCGYSKNIWCQSAVDIC